ncbi:MAG: ATPase, T2SS/T4P/T4SS family, partial [Aeromicrobium sp.]|uniref:ATPase, T2SS/T4P/T4SS family n=1 Tax=Aeromicrobium sp. TaxID=1871063 RepID=UPI0040379A7D
DTAELALNHPHVVRLESRPGGYDGSGSVAIRDLLRNSLRMRPDRIIVGEVRGGETMDMLSAMNTGHEGSLTTIHSNSPDEALSRAETLASMSDLDLPFQAVQEQVNNALDLIIQLDRAADGTRRITRVALLSSKGREPYKLHTLSEYVPEPIEAGKVSRGEHVFRPLPLAFVRRLQLAGEAVPDGATSPALD